MDCQRLKLFDSWFGQCNHPCLVKLILLVEKGGWNFKFYWLCLRLLKVLFRPNNDCLIWVGRTYVNPGHHMWSLMCFWCSVDRELGQNWGSEGFMVSEFMLQALIVVLFYSTNYISHCICTALMQLYPFMVWQGYDIPGCSFFILFILACDCFFLSYKVLFLIHYKFSELFFFVREKRRTSLNIINY